MSRPRHWMMLLAFAAASCGGKDEKDSSGKTVEKDKDKKDKDGKDGKKDGAEPKKDAGPASTEAAAKAFLDAIVKGDRATIDKLVPDAAACKAVPKFAPCGEIKDNVAKMWDGMKASAAAYKDAKITKSSEKLPFEGLEAFNAEVAGKEPVLIVAFKSGDRFYAAGRFPGVKPPSTGKEMPTVAAMKPEQALEIVKKAVAGYQEKQHDCNKIADDLQLALPVALPKVDKDSAQAYAVLQRCALDTGRWRAGLSAGAALVDSGVMDKQKPDAFVVAQIPRALTELGEYDKAVAVAQELAKAFPSITNSLETAAVYAICRAESWEKCLKTSKLALADHVKAKADPKMPEMAALHLLQDFALTVLDKPKDALADIAAYEKVVGTKVPMLENVTKEAQRAIDRGMYLETVVVPQVPTGVYHLMGKSADKGALVTLKLRDHTGQKRTLRIEAEIPGVTEKSSNSLDVGPHEQMVRWVNPPLKMDFDVTKVRSPKPSQLALKIVEVTKTGDKTIVDETLQIEVLPRDYLPLRRKVGADSMVPTYGYVGAWITSNDKTVEDFISKAKLRAPNKTFVGEQDVTVPQIKAIYDELKSRGMTYVMDPNVTSTQNFVQRTRLPAEVLASTNAQCLEGTLAFATLMEAIGIKPILVFVPGHAFVGWHTVPKDGTKGEPLFVETTMVGSYEFDLAMKVANNRVAEELKVGNFKTGASTFVDVAEIRKQGFSAQPL